MLNKAFFAVFVLTTFSQASTSQVFEKNGLPCVTEICIGDGLAELAKIKWDRSQLHFNFNGKTTYIDSVKIDSTYLLQIQSRYKGDIGQAAPFLKHSKFDNTALSGLSRVIASCEYQGSTFDGLKGFFTTQNGNPTEVNVALMPAINDTTKQTWTVVYIRRNFPAAISNEQVAEIKTLLSERYSKFTEKYRKFKGTKPGEGSYHSAYVESDRPFHISLDIKRATDEANRMKLHPLCGGGAKVKVD